MFNNIDTNLTVQNFVTVLKKIFIYRHLVKPSLISVKKNTRTLT